MSIGFFDLFVTRCGFGEMCCGHALHFMNAYAFLSIVWFRQMCCGKGIEPVVI